MVHTELDGPPPDVTVACRICGQPLTAKYHFIAVLNKWMRASIHVRCVELVDRRMAAISGRKFEREIPEKFRQFDPSLADQEVLHKAAAFDPDCQKHTLAILGPPGKGKSRIAWAVATDYFDSLREQTGANRWLDFWQFETLMADFDRHKVTQITRSAFALIDDIGCVDSFGPPRALVQAAIRSRIKSRKRSILTIDDLSFDSDLVPILKTYALMVTV